MSTANFAGCDAVMTRIPSHATGHARVWDGTSGLLGARLGAAMRLHVVDTHRGIPQKKHPR
jgi:hypothetical protein